MEPVAKFLLVRPLAIMARSSLVRRTAAAAIFWLILSCLRVGVIVAD